MEITLRYLTNAEMLAITAGWTGEQRPLFDAIPKLAIWLPDIQKAHTALVQADPGLAAGKLEEIVVDERETDNRHDHGLRSLYFAHLAYKHYLLAQDTVDTAHVHRIDQSSARLMVEGLSGVGAGYLAESGATDRAVKLAESDGDIKQSLGEIHVAKDVNGHAVLQTWSKHGARLGELERQKAELLAGSGQSDDTPTVAQVRKGWSRVVSTIMSVVDLIDGSPEAVEALRRSVVEPAEKATKRYIAARKAKSVENHSPAATPPDTSSGT